jgi:hypothetical protein
MASWQGDQLGFILCPPVLRFVEACVGIYKSIRQYPIEVSLQLFSWITRGKPHFGVEEG